MISLGPCKVQENLQYNAVKCQINKTVMIKEQKTMLLQLCWVFKITKYAISYGSIFVS